ncbi:transcriptional regulator [Flavobacterium sp. RSP49]|jgi:DNA-binding transcriptional ArsR family regulator|uniref:ArsR/SmtB family transcription factor n=1 Tax=unclassified Flavobacterium TaxID=196869 RepID=UPI000F823C51|nr:MULTISPECIES: helix-turn-helix transcriptional regulator [unclassified Flavobacterium]RTY87877.1 transcriptional regulator [Flavobacterium sp. RSP15]RTY99704.1 transcriptional regulator [Flavobacterium sp. RSP49]
MPKNKNVEFHSFEIELATLSKCLSHPARVMIISILSKHKDRTCKELVSEIPLSQSTVSKHLDDLIKVKLICRKISGTQSLYSLEWNHIERVFTLFNRLNTKIMPNRPKRNCC